MPEEARSGLGSVGPVFCHSLRVVWTLGACLVELWSATAKQPTPSSNISSLQRPLDRAYTLLVSPSSCPVIPLRRSRPLLRALSNVEPQNCRKRELGRCMSTIGQRTQALPFRLFPPLLALQQAPFIPPSHGNRLSGVTVDAFLSHLAISLGRTQAANSSNSGALGPGPG